MEQAPVPTLTHQGEIYGGDHAKTLQTTDYLNRLFEYYYGIQCRWRAAQNASRSLEGFYCFGADRPCRVQVYELNRKYMRMLVDHTNADLIQKLRHSVLADVPTIVMDEFEVQLNSSYINDGVLRDRLTKLMINVDPNLFDKWKTATISHFINASSFENVEDIHEVNKREYLLFELDVSADAQAEKPVFARDIRWLENSLQKPLVYPENQDYLHLSRDSTYVDLVQRHRPKDLFGTFSNVAAFANRSSSCFALAADGDVTPNLESQLHCRPESDQDGLIYYGAETLLCNLMPKQRIVLRAKAHKQTHRHHANYTAAMNTVIGRIRPTITLDDAVIQPFLRHDRNHVRQLLDVICPAGVFDISQDIEDLTIGVDAKKCTACNRCMENSMTSGWIRMEMKDREGTLGGIMHDGVTQPNHNNIQSSTPGAVAAPSSSSNSNGSTATTVSNSQRDWKWSQTRYKEHRIADLDRPMYHPNLRIPKPGNVYKPKAMTTPEPWLFQCESRGSMDILRIMEFALHSMAETYQ